VERARAQIEQGYKRPFIQRVQPGFPHQVCNPEFDEKAHLGNEVSMRKLGINFLVKKFRSTRWINGRL